MPGNVENENDAEEENDVATGYVAASFGVFDENWVTGWQGVLLLGSACMPV